MICSMVLRVRRGGMHDMFHGSESEKGRYARYVPWF